MHGQTVDALVRRLERLEGEARRWKGAVGVILAGLAALVLMGQAAPPTMSRVVEAEKFVLRDTRGKARAWLESSNGAVNLALADKEERSRVFLYVEADGAVVAGGLVGPLGGAMPDPVPGIHDVGGVR